MRWSINQVGVAQGYWLLHDKIKELFSNLELQKAHRLFAYSIVHPSNDALLFGLELFVRPRGVILDGHIRHSHHPADAQSHHCQHKHR